MSILDNLPHTATHRRRTRTRGTLGGNRETSSTLASGVSCWRQPAGDSEIVEFGKRGISVTDKFYYTADPGLDERDEIVCGGSSYDVRSAAEPDASAGLGVVYRVMAQYNSTSQ